MSDEWVYDHADPVQFFFETVSDISGGTVTIEGSKPDRSPVQFAASADVGPNGHRATKIFAGDDLDQDGVWILHAVHYEPGSTYGVPGKEVEITVHRRPRQVA